MFDFEYDSNNCACDTDTFGDNSGLDQLFFESGMQPDPLMEYHSSYDTPVSVKAEKLA